MSVTITHPARLTGLAHAPGTFTLGLPVQGRHPLICTAVACTECAGPYMCEHSLAARVILSAQQAPEPMRRQHEQQAQDRDLPTRTATLTRDQAAATLAVTTDWVRRLVKAGKLTAAGADVTAASVDAYAQTRHASRFGDRHPATEKARALAAAHRDLTRARKLEAEVDRLRSAYKATCERYGAGAHDGWALARKDNGATADLAAIRDAYDARSEAMPMKPKAQSWVLSRAA